MTEEFLHFIWKFRLFDKPELLTTNEEFVEILNPGTHNKNAGPDFINAKLRIGETLWAGNVEIHVNASDWEKHNHQNNHAYSNIILHVVFNNDKEIKTKSNVKNIPTLELAENLPQNIYKNYSDIVKAKSWIPCSSQINKVDDFILKNWLERILIERLERKSSEILQTLALNKNNWEQTFYQHIAKNFGFKVNDIPFELLAKSLPQKYLAKHRNNPFQLEAILMGQAGLLQEDFVDDYPILLKKEYLFLKNKFSLEFIESHLWKFMRTRPVNFPTIRISQFTDLISKSSGLFAQVIEASSLQDILKYFDIKTSSYWENHYVFDKITAKKEKKFGLSSINNIIINTIVPFYFAYAISKNKEDYKQKALNFLYETKKETNSIVKNWEAIGIEVKDAFSSQALIELKNEYCNAKRCLECQIGNSLIKSVNC